MNRQSKVIRTTRETVSLETLQRYLPKECWESIQKSFDNPPSHDLSDDIYARYFSTPGPIPLTEEEKEELFKTLGSDIVKGHYSTDQLRSFLEREPSQKKRR